MLSLLLMMRGAQAESYNYNLATTILVGTCAVTASDSAVTLPDVDRDTLSSGTLQQLHPLTISVRSCVGVGGVGAHPVLRVSGTTVAPEKSGDYLFNDGGTNSTAEGYGIVVSKLNETAWNPANLVKNGDTLTLPNINTDNTVYVAVGCGDAAACSSNNAPHAPGSISAGITFAFLYQ